MKLCVAVLLMTLGVCWAAKAIVDNGQPGCKTEIEISTIYYRNIWDPTSYWRCDQLGVAGTSAKCPDGSGWVDSLKSCVDWEVWQWEEAVDPPSKP